jgi:type IV pilus assembly protein PilA
MTVNVKKKERREFIVMDKLRLRSESGFTLIELLVVVAIIGILAAIAIPQFAAYRRRGYEAAVKTDLRNAATAQEAYFAANQTYLNGAMVSGTPPGFNKTSTVTSAANAPAGTGTFDITATHSSCQAGDVWTYSSTTGTITGGPCN